MVEDAQTDVLIPYDARAHRLISRIAREGELRPGDLRRLQAYTVGLYPRDFRESENDREEIAEALYVWRGNYGDVTGLQLSETMAGD